MSMLPPDAWPAVVDGLVQMRERDGELPTKVVAATAELCGRDVRTMWRWVNRQRPPSYERSSHELTQDDLAMFAQWHGNIAAVWRERYEGRANAPTLRTLQRAFAKQLTTPERAMAGRGVAARRNKELSLMPSHSYRNELWIADHSQLDALVIPTRSTRPQRPWSTIFIDAPTRVITGWALSLQPTHATALAALRRAVLPKHDSAQEAICGRPEMLQTDNGLEFTAERVTAAVLLMEGQSRTVRGYSPQLNGIVERLHRTMDQTWLAGSPFFTSSARRHDGQHVHPRGHLPPTFDQFVEEFADWVRFYNTQRPHSALGGLTPLAAWQADSTPLHVPDESRLDWMLEAPVRRKVSAYGIELGGLNYNHPALNAHAGRTLDVRAPVNEVHFIDCYRGTEKVCRATPVANWTADDRTDFMNARRMTRRRMNAARQQALLAQAAALDDQRVIDDPEEQAARDAMTSSDGQLRRSSDTDMLDLDLDLPARDAA